MASTTNKGLVQAVSVGTNAPTNTLQQWLDTSTTPPTRKDYNPVTSLWVAQGSAGAGAPAGYVRTQPTLIAVGGVPKGSTFPLGTTQTAVNDALFYPALAPTGRITLDKNVLEYGAPATVTATWQAVPGNIAISAITVGSVIQDPTLTSGTIAVPLTQDTYTELFLKLTLPSSVVQVGPATVTWVNKRFAFTSAADLLALGDAALSSALNGFPLGDAPLIAVVLDASIQQEKALITTAAQYLYFACGQEVVGSLTPSFLINGLPNNALVQRLFTYTNSYGRTTPFVIYRTQAQVSPNKYIFTTK